VPRELQIALQPRVADRLRRAALRLGVDEDRGWIDRRIRALEFDAAPQQQEQGQALGDGYPLGISDGRAGRAPSGGAGYGGGDGYGGRLGGMPGGSTTPGLGSYGMPALNAPQPNAPVSGPQPTDPFGARAGRFSADGGDTLAFDAERIDEVAAGLASRDVAIPQRGRMYRFTTSRGDLEITARSIPMTVLSRFYGLIAVSLAVCALRALMTRRARRVWMLLANSAIAGLALVLVGLLSIVLGIFPVAGLLAVAGGIAIAIRSRIQRNPAPSFVA